MTRTMQAALLTDVAQFEIRVVPVVDPKPSEVLVRVTAVGLCGTDIQIVAGNVNYNRDEFGQPRSLRDHPQILGHEICGVVAEAGSSVRDSMPGDRVVIDQGRTCISEAMAPVCEYCVTGDSHQCEHYAEHGLTGLPGGFAEYVTVPAVNSVRVEGEVSDELAALTEPLGCVLHASEVLLRTKGRYTLERGVNNRPVRTIVICGAGPAGLLMVQVLRRVVGFDGLLIVSEPNAKKRALAEHFGATTIDPSSVELAQVVAELTEGRRAEMLIESSGAGSAFRTIPGLVRKQATILLYGHGHGGEDLSLLNPVQFLEPTLVATTGASGGHDAHGRPLVYQRALRLIEDAVVDVASLITHRYSSLNALPSAFAGEHRHPDYVKGVVLL
ncbi:MAG: alcohol dehydrogenase catalytic domain-containing protein [Gemmatimonadaceae bacterium]